MRSSRLNVIVIAIALIGLVAVLAKVQLASRSNIPVDGFRLVTALAQYRRDCQVRGMPVPRSITLDALVQSGHLRREDTRAFKGVTLVFHSDADETRPQVVLVEARMPDGTWIVMLGDGSVQQMTAARYSEFRRTTGQPSSGANIHQPSR